MKTVSEAESKNILAAFGDMTGLARMRSDLAYFSPKRSTEEIDLDEYNLNRLEI